MEERKRTRKLCMKTKIGFAVLFFGLVWFALNGNFELADIVDPLEVIRKSRNYGGGGYVLALSLIWGSSIGLAVRSVTLGLYERD